MDPRYEQLAKILIDYSTKTKKGDRVLIHMKELEAFALVKAVYKQAILKGAFPEVYFSSVYFAHDRLKFGSDEQVTYYPKVDEASIEWADVWMGIRAVKNPYELKEIDAKKLAEDQKIYGRLADKRVKKCRWVLCWVPTEALAQKARMSMDETIDFFFSATLRDWSKEAEKYEKIREVFQKARQVRIVGKETDISFSTEGRTYILSDGTKNMPGGEVFTAPVEDSVEGKIYFDIPSNRGGQVIRDIYLEFKKGKVVKAQAKEGQEFLQKALEIDEGAQRVGEFAVGTNYGIQRAVLDILFDEKIGGTIHMALGRGYQECGSENKSDLHWDLIKDLRKEGEIYLDGKLVFKQGRFLF
jgi:aminopeptidase